MYIPNAANNFRIFYEIFSPGSSYADAICKNIRKITAIENLIPEAFNLNIPYFITSKKDQIQFFICLYLTYFQKFLIFQELPSFFPSIQIFHNKLDRVLYTAFLWFPVHI